jgi:long-chain fatty acid transport protein
LNLLGFPATSEDHYTVGASYVLDGRSSFDLAFVYSPKKHTEAGLSGIGFGKIINEHREMSFTIQYNYAY